MTPTSPATHRDDRLVPLVRICFGPLAVFTAVFGPLLFFTPGNTGSYWSWEVTPDLSAVWIGAAYMFGAVALVIMLVVGSWRATIVPVLSTLPFAVVMLVATIVHNDRFFTGTIRYAAWLAIYVILPVALALILVLNRRHDPGRQEGEFMLSTRLRTGLVCAGLAIGVLALLLVLKVNAVVEFWPWRLTPLMAMVIGGWLLFLATGGLAAIVEGRYAAYRHYFPAAALWFLLLGLGSLLHLDDFRDRGAGLAFLATVIVAALALGALFVRLEARVRARPQ